LAKKVGKTVVGKVHTRRVPSKKLKHLFSLYI